MTVTVATLGFPRIGPRRELKFALESFWSGKSAEPALVEAAAGLRAAAWARQHALGADHLPSGDFSFYDHVLDASVMLGAVPARYGWQGGAVDLPTYFAMARGTPRRDPARTARPARFPDHDDRLLPADARRAFRPRPLQPGRAGRRRL